MPKKLPSLYSSVRSRINLHPAWKKVFYNGIRSQSVDTQHQVRAFEENAYRNLERIERHLQKETFRFSPSIGAPIRRPGKDPRPIVIAPIKNRIVQRSILEVLQKHPPIQTYVQVPTSFGGVKDDSGGRRVQDAIAYAIREVKGGSLWYLRSDIQSFFTKVDRKRVLTKISTMVEDKKFLNLLEEALTTELQNLEELGRNKDLFPIYEIGVAQGCCLSPLMGNILLHDFDMEMNQRGVVCLRYIDDFLILGKKKIHVEKAFSRAQAILDELGFSAYDPGAEPEKAEIGKTADSFTFLGCQIWPDKVVPSSKSCEGVRKKIENAIKISSRLMANPEILRPKKIALVDTLKSINNILEGWGNQYSFCNCMEVFEEIDRDVDRLLAKYISKYQRNRRKFQDCPTALRQLLGVHPLVDSCSNPLLNISKEN